MEDGEKVFWGILLSISMFALGIAAMIIINESNAESYDMGCRECSTASSIYCAFLLESNESLEDKRTVLGKFRDELPEYFRKDRSVPG